MAIFGQNIENSFLDKSFKNGNETIDDKEAKEIIEEIVKIKKNADINPDGVNLHLKQIPEVVLRTALEKEKEDIEAYKKAFITGEWDEK